MDEHKQLPEEEEEELVPRPHWEPVPPPSTEQARFDAYQPPPTERTNRTAVIIIGIACGCIIILIGLGIIGAISVPSLLGARSAAINEKARNAARTVISAEFAYFASNKRYAGLAELAQGDYLDNRYANDPAEVGNGVTVTVTLAADGSGFQVVAVGQTADYIGDSTGVINERSH
jgi:type II secretory pathway pseudopilin PulG